MKELWTTSCTFVINCLSGDTTVECDWGFFFKKKKRKSFFSLPLYWWNGVLTLSWNSLHIPLIGADFIAMFDWQPEVNLKKKDPFCLPPPPHTSSTSSGNSSLSNCAENVCWKPECCVYSQCQPMPFTPSLPWTSLSQRTTTSYFPSKIHKEQDRSRKPERCVQPSSLCLPSYFNVKTLLYM